MLGVNERKVESYKAYGETLSEVHNNADGCFSGNSPLSYGK